MTQIAGLTVGAVIGAVSYALVTSTPFPPDAPPEPDVEAILQDFADDFASDPEAAQSLLFGIRVRDAEVPDWQVEVRGGEDPDVFLFEGFPTEPSAYFETDRATLEKLYSGKIAALTAMGKAFETDFAPLDLHFMDGYAPGEKIQGHLVRLSFHFWTRGFPEIVEFGALDATRELHGGSGILFYYQPGFRSGWFHLSKGQHVNADPVMQTNPFPSMLILTEGVSEARIGGKECTLRKGQMLYVGPGVTHELWVEDGFAEGILLMFGEGA